MKRSSWTKGLLRKRNALRKSLGQKFADEAFTRWMKAQQLLTINKAQKRDVVVEERAATFKPLSLKKINFGTYWYTIKCAKGKGAKKLIVTSNINRQREPSEKRGVRLTHHISATIILWYESSIRLFSFLLVCFCWLEAVSQLLRLKSKLIREA